MAKINELQTKLAKKTKIDHGKYAGMTREEAEMLLKKDTEREREFMNEKITGVFHNLESPGASIRFDFQHLPGDPYERIVLHHGQKVELKRCVIYHLKKNCFKKLYQRTNEGVVNGIHDGSLNAKQMYVVEKLPRFAFHPIQFMADLSDMEMSNVVRTEIRA